MTGANAAAAAPPDDAQSHAAVIGDATACADTGRFAEALALVDGRLPSAPADGDLLFARASILFAWGRHAEAHRCFLQAVEAGSRGGELQAKLGWTCLWLGRIDEAMVAMRRAIELAPDDWATHFGLATVLRAEKRAAESKPAFERALALNPDSPHCLSSLIACEIDLENFDAAECLARRLIEMRPRSPAAYADLGMALCSQERHDEAVAAFERAEALEAIGGDMGDDAVNFAICLLRAGRTPQALAMLERRMRQDARVGLHSHYALALLASGRFAEGWQQYEFRWIDAPLLAARPNFVKPQWAGQDLRGKTILLWSEQGFGDFIQFIRYAEPLKRLGANVLVFLREELRELATRLSSIDRILGSSEPYPAFDYYVNLLSVPRVLGTELDSIPADAPYLSADPDRAARWSAKIGTDPTLKVGIAWAGSPTHLRDRFRSLRVDHVAQLLDIPGVRFFSLQKGPAAAALGSITSAGDVVDLGPDLANFADTAAAVANLDLVIGVDTAVVHLAGALGKPVWALIPTPADWRWLEEREDSPWYPTMRLFRQRSVGDWDDVIARTKEALEDLVRRGAMPPVVAPARAPGSAPAIVPAEPAKTGARQSRVAETRMGIMQYFPDDGDVGRAVEYYGEHRCCELEFLERFVAPAMTVLEVDAGIGAHALWLSRRVGPDGHLFLYEADRMHRQVLEQNLKSNRVTNATLMRRRLRGSSGGDPETAATSASGDRFGSNAPAAEPDETIDQLRLERLDLLKINQGGAVPDVLEGAGDTLWRLRPRLHVRAGGDEELGRLAARVRDFGYGCWRSETALFNPRNFNRRDADVFSGRTAIALIALPEERVVEIALDGCSRIA